MYTICMYVCMYVCSEAAVASGARIVHFCGHDCIPWDLCVQQLAKALKQKEKDEMLAEVRTYVLYVCIFTIAFSVGSKYVCYAFHCIVCMYVCMCSFSVCM